MAITIKHPEGRNLLSEKEVAAVLGISVKALTTRRYRRQLPKFVKIGTLVRYPVADLEAWINENAPQDLTDGN